MNNNEKPWQQFERLVAAIHAAVDPSATIKWNDTVKGRQFDVTIRFKKGLYNYLTVIECKDHASPVGVSLVDAFVTKARDAGAHQAVLASKSGFQSGALEVASRHYVTLVHLRDSQTVEPVFGSILGAPVDAIHIERVALRYADGEEKILPTSSGGLSYYVSKMLVESVSRRTSLESILSDAAHPPKDAAPNTYAEELVSFPVGTMLVAPDDGEYPSKEIAGVSVRVGITSARTLTGPVIFDPSFWLLPNVEINNVTSGETNTIARHGLALGTAERFEPGVFYNPPQNDYFYYCEAVDNELATLYLVESFQVGKLVQAELKVKAQYAAFYDPVTDSEVIERLKRRFARMKSK